MDTVPNTDSELTQSVSSIAVNRVNSPCRSCRTLQSPGSLLEKSRFEIKTSGEQGRLLYIFYILSREDTGGSSAQF